MTSSVTLHSTTCSREHPLSHAQEQAAHILPKRNNHDNGTTQNKATKQSNGWIYLQTWHQQDTLTKMVVDDGHPPETTAHPIQLLEPTSRAFGNQRAMKQLLSYWPLWLPIPQNISIYHISVPQIMPLPLSVGCPFTNLAATSTSHPWNANLLQWVWVLRTTPRPPLTMPQRMLHLNYSVFDRRSGWKRHVALGYWDHG